MADMTKADLRRRMWDWLIACGSGYEPDAPEDSPGLCCELGIRFFGNWLTAIRNQLFSDAKDDYMFMPYNLEKFDTFDRAVDYVWKHLPDAEAPKMKGGK